MLFTAQTRYNVTVAFIKILVSVRLENFGIILKMKFFGKKVVKIVNEEN